MEQIKTYLKNRGLYKLNSIFIVFLMALLVKNIIYFDLNSILFFSVVIIYEITIMRLENQIETLRAVLKRIADADWIWNPQEIENVTEKSDV